jgi:glyoxylase-like metal-dependent hydrolase (beta-lactamase superfamily II)
MADASRIYRIGEATVTRVTETMIDFAPPQRLLPDWKPNDLTGEERVPAASASGGVSEHFATSVHTWVVRTPDLTILVDTGIGNGKTRPQKIFDHLDTPYLDRLKAAGVTPDEVDHVLITHIHTDHVGWNTVREADRWTPTFPNATYLFPRLGHEDFSSAEGRTRANYGIYEDSVLPVIAAGQARMVGPEGGEVLRGIRYLPTPGHSRDHMSIGLCFRGEEALFAGDVMHHPVQVGTPGLNSIFCADGDKARRSRARVLAYCAERDVTYFSSHFAGTSAGRIVRERDGYRWMFI